MRLLITGASGFIGREAVEIAVARGVEVHTITSSPVVDGIRSVHYHQVDLLGDVHAIRKHVVAIGATHLLHLAWYTVPGKFWDAEDNMAWIESTLALAAAFGDGGGKRLVAAGTCAEYDWTSGICNEETTPCAPTSVYGVAKDRTRRLLEAWAETAGVSFAWGRVFFLYGPREAPERLVPSVIRALLRGQDARVTEGVQVRDFLHVRDVADALVALLFSDVRGAVNIASGEPVPIRETVAIIGEVMGASDRILYGAIPMRPNDPPVVVADATRLRRELRWTPQFDLTAGLHDTIEWHRRN